MGAKRTIGGARQESSGVQKRLIAVWILKQGHVQREGVWATVEPVGLVCKAHRLVYHSTIGSRVLKKKKKGEPVVVDGVEGAFRNTSFPGRGDQLELAHLV